MVLPCKWSFALQFLLRLCPDELWSGSATITPLQRTLPSYLSSQWQMWPVVDPWQNTWQIISTSFCAPARSKKWQNIAQRNAGKYSILGETRCTSQQEEIFSSSGVRTIVSKRQHVVTPARAKRLKIARYLQERSAQASSPYPILLYLKCTKSVRQKSVPLENVKNIAKVSTEKTFGMVSSFFSFIWFGRFLWTNSSNLKRWTSDQFRDIQRT